MAQIILLVLLLIIYLGYYLIKSLNDFFKTAQKSHRQKILIKKHYHISTSLGLVCQHAKKCDKLNCKKGEEYGWVKCRICDGISDDSLWVKPCKNCDNSRLVRDIIGKCKKCEGTGFLPYGSHIQVADTDFPERMSWHDAINACSSLGDGWRLPTIEQLQGIYILYKEGRGNFGEYGGDYYWSSSLEKPGSAYTVSFYSGGVFSSPLKDTFHKVRAVRDFPGHTDSND